MERAVLRGISWDHSRAFPPLVATSQRYEELNPGVEISWTKRALNEFGHQPIDELAERFDLIVADHPWAGYDLARDLMLDLAPLLPPEVRTELERNMVGASFSSYQYKGRLFALPMDAATPVASWRPDLLARAGAPPPATWQELIALARRGIAVIPAERADLFLHFYMLCHGLGGQPATTPDQFAPPDAARNAIALLRDLTKTMPREIYEWSPILVAEAMSTRTDFAYSAFGYAYHNYARPHFAAHPLRFGPLVRLDNGTPLRGVLGGTGLAISRKCPHPKVALDYAIFTSSASVQRTLYFLAGGQPAHGAAWDDATVNALSGDFFLSVRRTHEEAVVRPRYCGWVPLQLSAGAALRRCLRDGVDPCVTLDEIDELYRASRTAGRKTW